MEKQHLRVVAAALIDNGRLFSARRNYGHYTGIWEFPGGKVKEGETDEEALTRELWEELKIRVRVGRQIGVMEHEYPEYFVTMYCYECTITEGVPLLSVHDEARWLDQTHLFDIKWFKADSELLEKIAPLLQEHAEE